MRSVLLRSLLALAAVAALVQACSTEQLTSATGQFTGPGGLAITSGGDRDLLFIASSGADELRALQMCTTPPLADGGVDTSSTCPANEDFRFLAGPIRVFPATINVIERPLRMAGVRLCVPNGADCSAIQGGAAIVVGSDERVGVVDARYLVDEANHRAAPGEHKVLQTLVPGGAPVDVAAANPLDANSVEQPSTTGAAFIAMRAQGTTPARIVRIELGLDSNGYVNPPVKTGSCDLTGVDPRRIVTVPGDASTLYVADGLGPGAVAVTASSIVAAGGPCAQVRHPFDGRPLRSVAVSPAWYRDAPPAGARPAGELLGGITVDGDLLFARTSDQQILPVPPAEYDSTDSTVERMEPLLTGGRFRDIAFLASLRCPNKADGSPGAPPCTPVYVGATSAGAVRYFPLLAVASATDGSGYFVDVKGRRFVNVQKYVTGPNGEIDPSVLIPRLDVAPLDTQLVFEPANAALPGGENTGWFNAGVTATARWTATWHGAITGLERRGGHVRVNADGTMTFDTPGLPLDPYQAAPASLRAGDVVSFVAYLPTPGVACAPIASETSLRFELPIAAISGNQVTLNPTADFAPTAATCPEFGVVAEFRTAADKPWLVQTGSELRTRLATGEVYFAHGKRFDYPPDYGSTLQSSRAADIELAFHIVQTDPVPGTQIVFSAVNQQQYTAMRDPSVLPGFATTLLPYTSPKVTNLTFMALTGGGSLLQADPLNLAALGGTIAYR